MSSRNFFAELRRRNVYKVAVAYIVGGWALSQGVAQVFPVFDVPNWAIRLIVLLIVLGLPIALILAWMFELTPQGIKRADAVDPSSEPAPKTHIWIYVVVIGGAISMGLFFLGRYSAVAPRQSNAPVDKSIAVLPFVNMSADKENEYLSDGITEDLCIALTQVKGLHVPARTSSFAFKGKTEDVRKIGEQLNVATVLEGSVSKAGNKLRITAQLINVADGYHLWAANYDREMTDILQIRSDISRQVVDALEMQLGMKETQRLTKPPTETSEAYQIYLLGRYEFNKYTETGFSKAIEHFHHALDIDSNFALASAGLAEAFNLIGYWNFLAPNKTFPEAKTAAERALQIDPNLPEAHSALGFVAYEYEWDYPNAERELAEAVRLNPKSADARLSYGEFLIFMSRFPEAREQLDRARESDPLSVRLIVDVATWYWFQRQYDRALAELQRAIDMDPTSGVTLQFTAYVLLKMNRAPEAVAHVQRAIELDGLHTPEQIAELKQAYETGGVRAFFHKQAEIAQQLNLNGKYRSSLQIALAYAAAGDYSEALKWLEKAVDQRAAWLPELKLEPTYDPFRNDPRFIALLKRVNLEK